MRTRRASLVASIALLVVAIAVHAEDKTAKSPSSPAVATAGGVSITAAQLEEKVGTRLIGLRTQEFLFKQQALEEMIAALLLEKEAASRRVSVPELIRAEVEEKAAPVTEEEKRRDYERARPRLGNKPEAEAMKAIEANLRRRHVQERSERFVAELRAKTDVRVLLEPPRVNVDRDGTQAKGPKDAPVTIVEFCDFQCPYCARMVPTLKRLEQRYGGTLRLVFRDYPLPFHAQAPKAAEAARCASEQGKFWQMHDCLFENQTKLGVADIQAHAAELGMDTAAFAACLSSGIHAAGWKEDMDQGSAYGVTGTPAFFINGRFLNGARPYEEFVQVIDDELERAKIPVPEEPQTAGLVTDVVRR